MNIKVVKGLITFKGVKYAKDEIISGVDKSTANYLLATSTIEVLENMENINDSIEATKENLNKKSKKVIIENGPNTNLEG